MFLNVLIAINNFHNMHKLIHTNNKEVYII